MLVKHLRDAQHRPFATIVAIDRNKIGVAICNTGKDNFNRKRGITIAKARAELGVSGKLPNRQVLLDSNIWGSDAETMSTIIRVEESYMRKRAEKYFKEIMV